MSRCDKWLAMPRKKQIHFILMQFGLLYIYKCFTIGQVHISRNMHSLSVVSQSTMRFIIELSEKMEILK